MKDTRITTNILQVIKNKAERAKATYIETAGKCFYLYKGDRIEPRHFEMMLQLNQFLTQHIYNILNFITMRISPTTM